jgi:hypothetical protein
MQNQKPKPRVFISCGQSSQNDERDIATRIGQLLERLGYDPYIAVVEKTLRGLKENLFARLSESEYCLMKLSPVDARVPATIQHGFDEHGSRFLGVVNGVRESMSEKSDFRK